MRNWIVIIASVLIILFGAYGSSVLLLDENRLKGLLAEQIERDSGRRIDIRGDLKISLFPGLRLEAEQIEISNTNGINGPALLSADYLVMSLRLLPMIRGELQASEVRLKGASINLHSDSDGRSNVEDLLAFQGASGSGGSWLDGPIRVDDVLINLSDSLGLREDKFSVDQIELNGFAIGEPLQFRFRGNVGDPALFDWIEIDALMRPQSDGGFRLANMRLIGSMEDGHFDIELLGNLDVVPGPPLSVSLDAGQLRINEHQFSSQLTYTAFDRPYINLVLASALIDVDVAALPGLLKQQLGAGGQSSVINGFQAMDFDLDLEIQQVAQEGLVLKDFELQAQSRDRLLTVDRLIAELPGAHMSALGAVNMALTGWSLDLGLRIDADDFAALAQSVPVHWMPSGSGAVSLAINFTPGQGSAGRSGQGAVEIWNGRWPVLDGLYPDHWSARSDSGFEFLSTSIEIAADSITLPEFQVVNDTLVAQGRIDLDWPTGEVAGALDLIHEQEFLRAQISGVFQAPEISWIRPEAGALP